MRSPTNSSDSADPEFEVTAELMVDSEDIEGTIDEEEMMDDENDDNELEDLQKESEMPLDDLIAMYYGNNQIEDSENVDPNSTNKPNENDNIDNDRNMNVPDMDDDFDPFHNQRVTRGLAAVNSQYFDGNESYSSDDDYQPTADDWKREIQVGPDHQADVESILAKDKDKETCFDDKLLWKPNIVSNDQLRHYLKIVYKLTDVNSQTPDRDDEQALYTLLQMKNVEMALKKRQEQERQPPGVSLWSEEECQNFEQGLRVFGKDFRLIQKNKVTTRTVGEIVQFYYLWKKTERHDAFVTQTKFGRKKYSIPGIADMMGRFLEENESVFSSRSASPNITDLYASTEQKNSLPNGGKSYPSDTISQNIHPSSLNSSTIKSDQNDVILENNDILEHDLIKPREPPVIYKDLINEGKYNSEEAWRTTVTVTSTN